MPQRFYFLFVFFFAACISNHAQQKNYYNDSIILLDKKYVQWIEKNSVSAVDPSQLYVGDGEQANLYYQALVPKKELLGTIVLFPGTWETTEHVWNSMAEFAKIAYENHLAVLVCSINQRLTLTDEIVNLINTMCMHALTKYHLPTSNFVFGGFSMGGIFSLRYAELAVSDSSKALIKPKAIFSCDGPCDLKHIYANFQRKKNKNPGMQEPLYGIAELERYCEGSPSVNPTLYTYYSPFSFDQAEGGQAKFLRHIPLRIYADVDPVWWMNNRHVDMYDLNALDQTALIQFLNEQGNTKAEFINAFQKGIRIEGNRHPHSWSIVEPKSCIDWILKNLKG